MVIPNAIKAIFSFILLVFVLFYLPTYGTYVKQKDLMYMNTKQATSDFVDNVRYKGYISDDMYEDFLFRISLSDILFNVEIEHHKKVYNPVLTDPTDPSTFTGDYKVSYDEYFTEEIKENLFSETGNNIYKMEKGDYIKVVVNNTTKLKSSIMFDFVTGSPGDDGISEIYVPYGGVILNEDY